MRRARVAQSPRRTIRFSWMCAVDYLLRDDLKREKRFDVVYHYADPEHKRRLRVKARVNEGEPVPSVVGHIRARIGLNVKLTT